MAVNKSQGFNGEEVTINIVDNADNKVLSTFNFGGYNGAVTRNKLGVAFLNGRFFFFYRKEDDSTFVYRYVDLSAIDTISAETTFVNASEIRVTSMFNAIYMGTLVGSSANVTIIPPTFVVPGPIVVDPAATSAPAISDEDLKVRLLYTAGGNLKTVLYNQSVTAQLHAPVIVAAAAYDFSATNYTLGFSAIYYNTNGTDNSEDIHRRTVSSTGTLTADVVLFYSARFASKAVTFNSMPYFFFIKAYNEPSYDTVFLAFDDVVTNIPRVVSQYGDRGAIKAATNDYNIPNAQVLNNVIFGGGVFLSGVQAPNAPKLVVPTTAFGLRADFSQLLNYFDAELSKNLHISGGILKMYDGQNVTEHGFLEVPPTSAAFTADGSTYDIEGGYLSAPPTTAGVLDVGTYVQPSGLPDYLPGGTYFVTYMYVYRDRNGQVHRSPPAIPWKLELSGATTYKMTHYVRTPTISEKDIIEVEVYRTQADGAILYRRSGFSSSAFDRIIVEKNDRNEPWKTLLDFDLSIEASLASQQPLYTSSGELEANNANASKYIITYKNRVWLLSGDGTRLFYSKLNIQGTPVEFNDNLYIDLDRYGGTGVALGKLDDYLVIFKEHGISILAGDGPNNLGQQNDYRPPSPVPTDAGCSEPNSIVQVPTGIMFKSQKGIYHLDRKLSATYLGDKVERYNGDTITSATLCDKVNEVRFTLNTRRVLVYDYYHGFWVSDTFIDAIDAVNHLGVYNYLRSDGRVRYETPGVFNDVGSFIKGYLRTAWVQFAGIQGYQRIYTLQILGGYKSAHNLIAQFAYNFNPDLLHEAIIHVTGLVPSTAYNQGNYNEGVYGGEYQGYQWEIMPKIQKCQSIQFTLEDTQDGAPGESFSLSNLAMEMGVLPGLSRTPKAAKFGAA